VGTSAHANSYKPTFTPDGKHMHVIKYEWCLP